MIKFALYLNLDSFLSKFIIASLLMLPILVRNTILILSLDGNFYTIRLDSIYTQLLIDSILRIIQVVWIQFVINAFRVSECQFKTTFQLRSFYPLKKCCVFINGPCFIYLISGERSHHIL